jgi:hypothetical protein
MTDVSSYLIVSFPRVVMSIKTLEVGPTTFFFSDMSDTIHPATEGRRNKQHRCESL